jgi:RNA polymerase sigma-70 factor (ECF subfamily)
VIDARALHSRLADAGVTGLTSPADLGARVEAAIVEAHARFGAFEVPIPALLDRVARAALQDPLALPRVRIGDLCLACACGAGDPRALAALEAHFASNIAAAFRCVRTRHVALDDFAQSVRQKLLGPPRPKIDDCGGLGDLRAWIQIVATRTALDLARAAKVREEPTAQERFLDVPAPGDAPDLAYLKRLYGREVAAAVESAARALSPEARNVLRDHYARGLTIDQIGRAHGVHRATAARRVQRARDELVVGVRATLIAQLGVSDAEIDSVMRLVESQLDITMERVLK